MRSRGSPNKGEKIRSGYICLAFSGARNGAEWLHKACVLGAPNNGGKIRSGYITPAFSGAPNWVECLRNPGVLGCPPTMGRKSEVAT